MKLSIRTKLLSIFFVLTLLFLAASISGYLNAEALRNASSRNANSFVKFHTISELDRLIREQAPILIRTDFGEKGKAAIEANWRRFRDNLEQLGTYSLTTKEKRLFLKINSHDRLLRRQINQLFSQSLTSNRQRIIAKKVAEHTREIVNQLNKIRNLIKDDIFKDLYRINEVQNTQKLLAFGVFGMILSSLALAVFFTRYITAPISKFHQEVKYISHGHLDRRLDIKTGDEIEDLAKAFNQMVASLYDEEQTAARLQKRLLPPKKIRVKGIKIHAQQIQAKVVGGDWYDYYHTDNSISFLIADASGKGMAGALLATLAMSSIRSEAKTLNNIDMVLRKTNKTIESRLGAGNFVTLFYGHLSLENHLLTYINCGHELPLLFRAESDVWSILDCRSSLPIGISTEHFHPRKEKVFLNQGDKILLYTDGLHDARNAERRFFNIDAILEWLNSHARYPIDHTIDELLEKALSFCQRQIPDDITLLGLEIVAKPDLPKALETGGDYSSTVIKN